MKRLLCIAAAFAGGMLHAQSVTVAPSYASIGLSATTHYSATTMGLASSAVTWSAGGVTGGNTAAGTIDQNGNYTAPSTMPGQNPVTIRALSQADGRTTGIAYAYLLTAGPVITAVAPNPLPVGTYTVTVSGSGFQAGAEISNSDVQLVTTFVNSTTLTGSGYQGPAKTAAFSVKNAGSVSSNTIVVTVSGSSSGSGGGSSGSGGGGSTSPPVVSPAAPLVVTGGTQQFTAPGATSWSAVSGTVTASGLYTAPTVMPASGTDTVTASNAAGSGKATITLISSTPPSIQSITPSPLPLGVFSITITGTGFISQSVAQVNGAGLNTTYVNGTTLTATGFAGAAGSVNLTVNNGPVNSQPLVAPVGIQNPQVSAAAARRFLEQGAFGPTPTDAAHVQTIGYNAWLNEQFATPVISSYHGVGNQGGMPIYFLANAVTNADQLRQKVAFALSQIFVTSINTVIWNTTMEPYQEMLLADAFTNYRQILGDITLSPAMGQYLNMANNAKVNPAANTVANENFARECMQLFSIGTALLNPDGSVQLDVNSLPLPTYSQFTVTEFARVFTGWTYAPPPGSSLTWNAYINTPGVPMVPFAAEHDTGSKTLLNGYVSPAGLPAQQDLNNGLDNIFNHPNVGPFIGTRLIQHLVKSNPSPAYVQRVAAAFANNGQGVRGDMKAVISAVLLDPEARANDNGGGDQATDGHYQEPALFIAAMVRAFGGQMNIQNYYAQDLAAMGQDIFNSPSVFNYYSPLYQVPGTSLIGPEMQIDTTNNAIYRANVVYNLFSAYSNPVQTYGPGTTVDLTPLMTLPAATMIDALDLTLTHGVMPAQMKQAILTAVNGDSNGTLHRIQTAIYLIVTSSYYNVWH